MQLSSWHWERAHLIQFSSHVSGTPSTAPSTSINSVGEHPTAVFALIPPMRLPFSPWRRTSACQHERDSYRKIRLRNGYGLNPGLPEDHYISRFRARACSEQTSLSRRLTHRDRHLGCARRACRHQIGGEGSKHRPEIELSRELFAKPLRPVVRAYDHRHAIVDWRDELVR